MRARADLRAIDDYIAVDNPVAAADSVSARSKAAPGRERSRMIAPPHPRLIQMLC